MILLFGGDLGFFFHLGASDFVFHSVLDTRHDKIRHDAITSRPPRELAHPTLPVVQYWAQHCLFGIYSTLQPTQTFPRHRSDEPSLPPSDSLATPACSMTHYAHLLVTAIFIIIIIHHSYLSPSLNWHHTCMVFVSIIFFRSFLFPSSFFRCHMSSRLLEFIVGLHSNPYLP